ILFLDEPTIGLDAVSKIAVRRFIKGMNAERGTTVILTTHDMQDIEAIADRIILVGKGRILLDGGLEELRRRSSDRKVLTVEHRGAAPAMPEGMEVRDAREGRLVIDVDPAIVSVSEAIAYLAARMDLDDVNVSGISSEEMVAALYKGLGI
ncbi:MAG: ABC transporter, partial [Oscillospiraceae bacterium]|nr:ABC transporter [Oscillospiraceae bacterium]